MRVASRHGFCLLPLPPSANNHNIVLALVPSIDASLRQGILATYPAARAYIQRDRESRVASNAMRLPCLISRPGPQLAPSPPPWGLKSAPTHPGGSMLMLMLKPMSTFNLTATPSYHRLTIQQYQQLPRTSLPLPAD
ncbi:hypothetical protein CGMCC3_g13804 [Colletotrichum fructicola]|nr:uncharacterized protein CGMCC3_g13804 [Colletotrichum fructicola]KAE9569971.1 hypothetical protein CGMCC3_g13804 [Colletotrichum fructicola]